MATLEQLQSALVKADAAGNADDAKMFADAIRKMRAPPEPSMLEKVGGAVRDTAAGAVRGAGSIGATLLYPVDKGMDLYYGDRGSNLTGLVTGQQPISRNEERRAAMDAGLQSLVGADPKSVAYSVGKIGGELAGTAGVGGPIGQLVGKIAPKLGAAVESAGMVAPGANLATRSAGAAINGGAAAGLVNPEDAGLGALIGGATPAVVTGAMKLGRAVAGGRVAPEVAALADRAKQLGIDIPADRIANNKVLNATASALNYVPFSGRAQVEETMAKQLDRAVTRTFGQNSENVTQALRKARTDLGAEFDRTLKSTPVAFDQQLLTDIAAKQQAAAKELGSDLLRPIDNQINELLAKGESGVIDGQAAYNIKRQLDRIAKSNTPTAYHAEELKGVLMDALNRSLGPQEAAKFATTRKQYGNMLELERLAQNGAEGGISAARLSNMKGLNNPDLQELADIASQFVKNRESQHSAAQRGFAGLGISGVAGPAALAGSVAGGRAINSLISSDAARNYVLKGPASADSLTQLTGAAKALPVIGSAIRGD
jgi:hypothetical protein